MRLQPERLHAGDPRLGQVLALIQQSFAYMEGRVDPPSSIHRLTVEKLSAGCNTSEVWVWGAPPVACVFLTPRPVCLYLGKFAVAQSHQGQGMARQMVDHALGRAHMLNLPALEVQTRVELTENHTAFTRLGFVKTSEGSHPGYDRITEITLRRAL